MAAGDVSMTTKQEIFASNGGWSEVEDYKTLLVA